MRGALILSLALALPLPAAAQGAMGAYSAADCAAFWSAYARRMGGSDIARLAEGFGQAAQRIEGAGPTQARRDAMLALIRAYIENNDRQSRDLFNRLAQACSSLAAELPETRGIRM
ncbi:hypothetical protein [Pseudoroseicyclus aestuarii]|uniref:HdeA/HdeB family protein n=1 Tax=Pseudoroseicyclus aestuarii TaxID=1795041 RepID=A0A318T088_9RHOB|nr:hypothetical protein [Pseudoroseicyclus aestuarii]PYE82507.1 hypothetical protein DFP88_104264 [Pseudoroseicyclus aestuarii]